MPAVEDLTTASRLEGLKKARTKEGLQEPAPSHQYLDSQDIEQVTSIIRKGQWE